MAIAIGVQSKMFAEEATVATHSWGYVVRMAVGIQKMTKLHLSLTKLCLVINRNDQATLKRLLETSVPKAFLSAMLPTARLC
jgi:hypothetical protein